MRRNWYTTTGLAVVIAALVLAGCSSADAELGKVEKVEKEKEVEKEVEVEKEGKPKAKVEKRGLSDLQKENASDSQSAIVAAVAKRDLTYM